LQPHFLFNTINSILALLPEDAQRASEMLERLARLLRFALDSQQTPSVRLSDELRLVKDYLEIEQTRFGKRLQYTVESPSDLGGAEIPAYALQTLVENSMKHAISPRRDGGNIAIRVTRSEGALLAEVFDDGPGFSRDALRSGHGLDMLERRLDALHGSQASVEIASNGSGACVRLRIPLMVAA
jgi:LytS/YehU family sensor histidine kinase